MGISKKKYSGIYHQFSQGIKREKYLKIPLTLFLSSHFIQYSYEILCKTNLTASRIWTLKSAV